MHTIIQKNAAVGKNVNFIFKILVSYLKKPKYTISTSINYQTLDINRLSDPEQLMGNCGRWYPFETCVRCFFRERFLQASGYVQIGGQEESHPRLIYLSKVLTCFRFFPKKKKETIFIASLENWITGKCSSFPVGRHNKNIAINRKHDQEEHCNYEIYYNLRDFRGVSEEPLMKSR